MEAIFIMAYPEGFIKVRFTSKHKGATAGLVFNVHQVRNITITKLSQYWPHTEALKTEKVEYSAVYPTWEAAFAHEFDAVTA